MATAFFVRSHTLSGSITATRNRVSICTGRDHLTYALDALRVAGTVVSSELPSGEGSYFNICNCDQSCKRKHLNFREMLQGFGGTSLWKAHCKRVCAAGFMPQPEARLFAEHRFAGGRRARHICFGTHHTVYLEPHRLSYGYEPLAITPCRQDCVVTDFEVPKEVLARFASFPKEVPVGLVLSCSSHDGATCRRGSFLDAIPDRFRERPYFSQASSA